MTALAALVCGLAWAGQAHAQDGRPDPCDGVLHIARSTVTLHLIDRTGLPEETRRELMREAIVPWRGTGVDVQWAPDDEGADGGADHLYVTLTREDGTVRGPGFGRPLASILFVDGRPTTQVQVFVGLVERLAAAARFDDRAWLDRPALWRERSLGRALGRVIAHEVGHYVFASAAHTPRGLMRPHHPIERLMTASAEPFQVLPPP